MKLKYSIKLLLFFVFCSFSNVAFGQTENIEANSTEASSSQVENNDEIATNQVAGEQQKAVIPTTNILHQNGRINLVVFVLAIIFVGIILYLIRIERTLNKIEKK